MERTLRVAAVQVQSDADVAANLGRCREQMERAAYEGAELIVLPENFAYFGTEAGKRAIAETLPAIETRPEPGTARGRETSAALAADNPKGTILQYLASFARERQVTVVGGGMPERSADPLRPYNTSVVLGPDGQLVTSYRKVHLFDATLPSGQVYRESDATSAGDQAVLTDVNGYRVGLSVCYDLRFAQLYLALAQRGADVITVPAAFTYETGAAHWHVLLRARAIECQTYVVAAAQCGDHPGARRTYGHAMVIDPWGAVLSECIDGPGFALGEVDHNTLIQVRDRLPCAQHRRTV